ncbi:MAG: hypothetical protein ACE5I7_01490 [Candidatus Binatia bacterium]
MSAREGYSASLRCHHCGREVAETMHTRSSYRVDYYALHTGEVEAATMVRGDDAQAVSVLKLLRVTDFVTCADCYRRPEIRSERELLFRPERVLGAERAATS